MPLSRITLEATLNALTQHAAMAEPPWDTTEWTRRVKSALIQLGMQRHYTPYPPPADPQGSVGEWLYDVIWVRMDGQNHVMGAPLVAESEWGDPGEVWDDFQKLLVARAEVRVMIFDNHPGLLAELQAHIQHYAVSGDRYLLAQYLSLADGFRVVQVCRE